MINKIKSILLQGDGTLPDIEFNFNGSPVAAEAYALAQSKASKFGSLENPHYWSRKHEKDIDIQFGENPAQLFINDEIDCFHVVFSGITSSGSSIPDIGFFVLDHDFISLDYQKGNSWDENAIRGLFELMEELSLLGNETEIRHDGNFDDPDGNILLNGFNYWKKHIK